MKAMILDNSTQASRLVERDLPIPTPSPAEVLIRIHAAGVTPSELSWLTTTHTKDGQPRHQPILGHEFSGVVAALGEDAGGFRVGQEVYGMNDWFAEGATAEYCLTTPSSIAEKPARLNHAEAATVPIAALTAHQGLFGRARLGNGERILIHGGAGAVGVFAIQLAKLAGAQVFTTASERHRDFLQHIGADHVIDYRTERFEDHVRNLDVIFDGVGGGTLHRSWPILAPIGRLVTIAADSEAATDARTKAAYFIVEPDYAQLMEIGNLLNRGLLKPFVDGIVPLAQASAAYFGTAPRRDGRGKLVIAVPSTAP